MFPAGNGIPLKPGIPSATCFVWRSDEARAIPQTPGSATLKACLSMQLLQGIRRDRRSQPELLVAKENIYRGVKRKLENQQVLGSRWNIDCFPKKLMNERLGQNTQVRFKLTLPTQ